MWKLVILILLLVGGAAVNTAIAMACARWGDGFSLKPPDRVDVDSVPEYAEKLLCDPTMLQSYVRSQTGLRRVTNRTFACTRVDHVRWFDGKYSIVSYKYFSTQFGLPFRSMHYAEYTWAGLDVRRVQGWRGGWPLPIDSTVPGMFGIYDQPAHVYPLTPLPLGFTLNTLVYAVFLSPLALVAREHSVAAVSAGASALDAVTRSVLRRSAASAVNRCERHASHAPSTACRQTNPPPSKRPPCGGFLSSPAKPDAASETRNAARSDFTQASLLSFITRLWRRTHCRRRRLAPSNASA